GLCAAVDTASRPPSPTPAVNPFREALAQKTSGVKPAVPGASTQDDLNDLSQQGEALLVLYYLDATPAQLKAEAAVARETAARPRDRKPAKASIIFRRALTEIRAALLKNDTERITDLADKLDELRETEKSEFDDDFATTDAARKRAPEIVRRM